MTAKIQLRRDSAANWAANTLSAGEVGLEIESNTVVGVKIGGNTTATAYNALDYLAGTLPERTTTSISTFNDAALRKFGRFTFSNPVGVTDGPITFASTDGAAHMLVLTFETSAIQFVHVEGDGTVPSKFYQRIYDGGASAWRAWHHTTNWATDASTGTPITCTTLDAKGVATFADGSANNPSIANNGDLNTGISFPADNTLVLSTDGTAAITIGSAQGVTLASNLVVGGDLNMTNGFITSLATPNNNTDAATKGYVDGARIGQTAVVAVDGTSIGVQVSGTSTSGLFTIASAGIGNLRSVVGTWQGIACSSTGNYAKLDVNTGSASTTSVNGGTTPTNTFWATLVRIS